MRIDNCIYGCLNAKILGRGMCQLHYHRWHRYGDPLVKVKEQTAAERDTPEYRAWKNIKTRCYNKNLSYARYYSGKGIQVCERWRTSYFAFLEDMGRKPGLDYSIDRIDSDGDYEPSNCRWATPEQQYANRKPRSCWKAAA